METKTLDNQKIVDFSLFNHNKFDDKKVRDRVRKWIKALKSGKFTQGSGKLEILPGEFSLIGGDNDSNESHYCCLGVANKVCKLRQRPEQGTLSHSWALLGLNNSGGEFRGVMLDRNYALTDLNDRYGWSFDDIANLLQDQYNVIMKKRRIIIK